MPAHNKDLEGMIDIDIGIEKYRENGEKYSSEVGLVLDQYKLTIDEDIAKKKTKVEKINEAIISGVSSLKEICILAGLKPRNVMHICRIHNIKLPDDLAPSKSRPEIDSLVEQGLKLQDIGDRVGLSKERIRQYIFESGQSKEYKNAKLSIKYEIINKRKSILSLLEER